MHRKTINSRVALCNILFALMIVSVLSSCSNISSPSTDYSNEIITIPLTTEIYSSEDTHITEEVEYLNIDYSINEDGCIVAHYDDISVCLGTPKVDVVELPIYSVLFDSSSNDVVLDNSNYTQLFWNWYSISLPNYGVPNDETVDVNNEFINSYQIRDIYDGKSDVINTIMCAFPNAELADYLFSYYFELGTIYENYDAYSIEEDSFEFSSDFEEYNYRDSIDSIPIGNINESRRNLFGVYYDINDVQYYGSIVGPDNNFVIYDGTDVYRYIYYPISHYEVVTEPQPVIPLENCINSVIHFLINEKEKQRISNVNAYAAELVYVVFYDSPEYCSSEATNANYYLVPVWAVYYQMGNTSQQVRRGTVYINAYTGGVY